MNTELSLDKQEQKEILPFAPQNLWLLFFQPKKFFSLAAVYHHRSIMIAAYLIGVFAVKVLFGELRLKLTYRAYQCTFLQLKKSKLFFRLR